MAVFVLLGLFVGITTVSLRRSTDREGPRGLAYTVAADLRAARAEAQRTGALVAYCLPNDNGAIQFSQSAVTRRGEQVGSIQRVHGYSNDFQAFLFIGGWPDSAMPPATLPLLSDSWRQSVEGQYAVFFRPDGTAFSTSIAMVDGHLPIVVGSTFELGGSAGGGLASLSAVRDPFTVWVSEGGAVRVDENLTPAGPLTEGGSEPPQVAELRLDTPPSVGGPKILDVAFLPSKTDEIEHAGVGQSYTQIHPEQRDEKNVEYGLATFDIRAEDPGGGPLFYKLTATPRGGGEAGKFSSFSSTGRMNYRQVNERLDRWAWNGFVSWRPPPGATADTIFDFEIEVFNRDGGRDVTTSGAGLIPVFATLGTPRLAIESLDHELFLATVEASSLIKVSIDGKPEMEPFFSADGTRVFTFSPGVGESSVMNVRNADGSGNAILSEFPTAVENVKFDPMGQFAAYTFGYHTRAFPWTEVRTVSSGEDSYDELVSGSGAVTGRRLEVLHLNSRETVLVTDVLDGPWEWDAGRKFHINYQHHVPSPLRSLSPFSGSGHVSPGHVSTGWVSGKLVGFPPQVVSVAYESSVAALDRVFNLQHPDWYIATTKNEATGLFGLTLRRASDPGFGRQIVEGLAQVPRKPAWSSDGRTAVYAYREGTSGPHRLVKRRLLSSGTGASLGTEELILEQNGIREPKMSPDGEYVFFLRAGHLWRIEARAGARAINLTRGAVGSGVANYAVTR